MGDVWKAHPKFDRLPKFGKFPFGIPLSTLAFVFWLIWRNSEVSDTDQDVHMQPPKVKMTRIGICINAPSHD